MAKPVKRKVPGGTTGGGRMTPKGGDTRSRHAASAHPTASSRYTPPTPTPMRLGGSDRFVPAAMLTFLGLGVLMIVVNYMSVLLPGAPSNWYIVGGLGLILAGILTATQWR